MKIAKWDQIKAWDKRVEERMLKIMPAKAYLILMFLMSASTVVAMAWDFDFVASKTPMAGSKATCMIWGLAACIIAAHFVMVGLTWKLARRNIV